jgi:glycerophosphoryl diester phosphodiesterase
MIWEIFSKVLIAYPVVSLVLFVFPNILHRRKSYKSAVINEAVYGKKVLHISHRGGAREGLENTVPTFQHAVDLGSNMLEMDVCMTKDGILVVSHDSYLDRLCGQDLHIHDLNYKDLPKHADQVLIHFTDKQRFETGKQTKNYYFPTLEEIFTLFPTILINVELKTPTEEAIIKTGEMIRKYKREHTTVWGCKSSKDTKIVNKYFPEALLFFPIEKALGTYLLFITGLLPFFPIRENSLQMVKLNQEYYKWKASENISMSTKCLIQAIRFFNWVSPVVFWHLHKRGVVTVYWVLNSEVDFEDCVKQGVHGIMTDTPTLLRSYLDKKGLHIPNDIKKND